MVTLTEVADQLEIEPFASDVFFDVNWIFPADVPKLDPEIVTVPPIAATVGDSVPIGGGLPATGEVDEVVWRTLAAPLGQVVVGTVPLAAATPACNFAITHGSCIT